MSADEPWTPERLLRVLNGCRKDLHTLIAEIQRRLRPQVLGSINGCQCLRIQVTVAPDDLVQETLLRLTRAHCAKLREWRGEPASLWTYIRGFTWRVVNEACRTCKRRPAPNDRAPPDFDTMTAAMPPYIDETIDTRKLGERAHDELEDQVSERKYKVFMLSISGLSREEIAAQLGMKIANVDQDLHIARKKFKEIWERLTDASPLTRGGDHEQR